MLFDLFSICLFHDVFLNDKITNGNVISTHLYGLVQDCSVLIANGLEILQSCPKLSIADMQTNPHEIQ